MINTSDFFNQVDPTSGRGIAINWRNNTLFPQGTSLTIARVVPETSAMQLAIIGLGVLALLNHCRRQQSEKGLQVV